MVGGVAAVAGEVEAEGPAVPISLADLTIVASLLTDTLPGSCALVWLRV